MLTNSPFSWQFGDALLPSFVIQNENITYAVREIGEETLRIW